LDSYYQDIIVVYGYSDSAAETYSNENNFTFVALDKEPDDEIVVGDIDNDNEITVFDATSVQFCVAQLVEFSEKQTLAADTDNDGSVSVLDATRIQMYVARIITEF